MWTVMCDAVKKIKLWNVIHVMFENETVKYENLMTMKLWCVMCGV
jgi:hypothetical protein